MGESHGIEIGLGFNGSVRVRGRGQKISADGGSLVLRELDDSLGLSRGIADELSDGRTRSYYSLQELLRLRLYLLALGYSMQSDSDLLRNDPGLRLAVSDNRGLGPLESPLASQPTLSRFTHLLAEEDGKAVLERGLVQSAIAGRRLCGSPSSRQTLDIDSLPLAAHGLQGGSEYNGYYRRRCFHPQAVMHGESGHLLAAHLRRGKEATATGAIELLGRVIDQMEEAGERVGRVRGDAGFPSEPLLRSLEERGVGYTFRFKNNAKLNRIAEPYLVRPQGRRPKEPREWTYVLRYRAQSWSRERRLVLVVQEAPDSLYLHHFFLVTSDDTTTGRQLLNFYRQRGTMEGRLGEWTNTLNPALSSSHRDATRVASGDDTPFQVNAATLLLNALAYNLLHTLRCIAAKSRIKEVGSALGLGRARRLLLSVAARLIVSARQASVLVSEHVTLMWSRVLSRIRRRASTAKLA